MNRPITFRHRAWGVRRWLVAAALATVACMGAEVRVIGPNKVNSGGPDTTGPTLFLTVTPPLATISVGSVTQLVSKVQDASGNVLTGQLFTWSSANTGIASVDNVGDVTGNGPGTTQITVSTLGLAATASVTVSPVPVASVGLAPRTDTLQVGQTVQLVATPKDATGGVLTGRVVTWSSNNPGAASVSGSGLVTAASAGVATITVTCEGVTNTAVITVVFIPVATVQVAPALDTIPLGATHTLTATPKDGGGNPLSGRVITWTSGSTAIATVNSSGQVFGKALGTTTITATSEGQSGSATVTVVNVPVATVAVAPPTSSIQTGATVQLSATTRDAAGNVLAGRVITWASGNTAVATVNPSTGLVTGVAAGGPAVITATSEGKNGTASVTVTNPPPVLVRVLLTPDTATLLIGGTKQFSVSGKFSDSTTKSITATYSATGGTIGGSGLYTAGQTGGVFRAIATSAGLADTSTITVVRPSVKQVIVSPALDTIAVGLTRQLGAVTKDSLGNVLTGRVVTWASANSAVATVNSGSGLVTAVAPGTVTITATSEGINGTSSTVVNVVLAASVQVAPATGTVLLGQNATLTATARDKSGNILTGHAVTWTSLNTAVASVNNLGIVTALTVGTATVRATVDTASGTASVQVDTTTVIAPLLQEDFSTYISTANLLADPRGIYSVGEDVYSPGEINLDTSVGYGTSTKSMRYDFPARAGNCTDFSIGRNLNLPADAGDIYLEVVAKFQNGWTNAAPGCAGVSNEDYKFLFGRVRTSGRFNVMIGTYNSQYTVGYPGGEDSFEGGNISGLFDGNWHVYRFHMKVGASGACKLWVDGVVVKDYGVVNMASNLIYGIALGRNINQGPPTAQSLWWGRIRVYNTNPGW